MGWRNLLRRPCRAITMYVWAGKTFLWWGEGSLDSLLVNQIPYYFLLVGRGSKSTVRWRWWRWCGLFNFI